MYSSNRKPVKAFLRRRGQLDSHLIPALVWLAAVACIVVLFQHRSQRFEILGVAQGQVHQIATTCLGRLDTIPVELYKPVQQGQTVAVINTVLDNENTEAELAVITAEIEHLQATLISTRDQLAAEATDRQTESIIETRRFDVDVENARIRILELKSQLESDRITAQDLALEVQIAKDLLREDAISPYQLQKAENQYQALSKLIEENNDLLVQAEQDLKQAQQRKDEFAQFPQVPLPADNALEVIRKAIGVQEQRMAQITARHQTLELKSPVDGIVNLILKGPGEAISPGELILTVAEQKPTQIVAYVDEHQVDRIEERMIVQLIKNGNPGQIAESQVISLGSSIELLPQRLWSTPTIEQWGRPILIKIPPGFDLLLNQMVGIKGL